MIHRGMDAVREKLLSINSPVSDNLIEEMGACLRKLLSRHISTRDLTIWITVLSGLLKDAATLIENPRRPYLILKPECIFCKDCMGGRCQNMVNLKNSDPRYYYRIAISQYLADHVCSNIDPETLLRV